MASESKRGRLPFEPRQNKKKTPKKAPTKVESNPVASEKAVKTKKTTVSDASLSAIPDVVSKRMARRMTFFSGIPTALGISSFFVFYWISSHQWVVLPPYVALFVSFALFGLGFIGLSYGIFSASWDEAETGSWLGTEQLKVNWQRTTSAWKSSRKNAKEN